MRAKLPKDVTKTLHNKQLQIDPQFKQQLSNQLFKGDDTMATAKKSTNPFIKLKSMKYVPLGALVITLVFVGGASALITNNRAARARLTEAQLPADLADVIPVNDIKTKALSEAVAGSKVSSIELKQEEGALVYKVLFADGSFKLYDAKTGNLITKTTDDETESDDDVPAGFVAGIAIEKAREIAQAQRPGKTITKIELETEDGKVVYSVRFSDNGRVDVSATDGSVIRVKNPETKKTSGSTNSQSGSSDSSSDDNNSSEDKDDDNSDDSNEDSNEDTDDDNSGSGSNSGSGGGN